jgi:NhaP-type Na+/H+ or K+/H+ antiporter
VGIGFPEGLLLLGAILAVGAALSGWLQGTVLSLSVLSVLVGIALALADLLTAEAGDELIVFTVELALILTLFSDGLFVERELLQQHWTPAARALVLAMPLTLLMLALAAKILFSDLSWAEAFLLAAVLSPTDPVVTSAVVTSPRIPATVRHTLNLESGLNDGLALPFVLFFLALAVGADDPGLEAGKLAGEAIVGAAIGIALALASGRALSLLPGGGIQAKYEGVYGLAIAFLAFGLAETTWGNGLIAAFVGGIAAAVSRHDLPDAYSEFNESVSATFQVIVFVLFGAIVVETGWNGSTPALLAFIAFALLVARPAAVLVAFMGVDETRPNKLFIAWFGPKGVASILFALLVVNSQEENRTLVFDVASFTVLASICAHGLTDTVGARWLEAKLGAGSVGGDDDDVRQRVEGDENGAAHAVVPSARDE